MSEPTHADKFRAMAKEKHIAITNLSLFGLRGEEHLRELLREDKHLNNIPLRLFDGLTGAFNSMHPVMRMSLSEGTYIYKQLLEDLVT